MALHVTYVANIYGYPFVVNIPAQSLLLYFVVFMLSMELCRCSYNLLRSSRPRTRVATAFATGYTVVKAQSVNLKNADIPLREDQWEWHRTTI